MSRVWATLAGVGLMWGCGDTPATPTGPTRVRVVVVVAVPGPTGGDMGRSGGPPPPETRPEGPKPPTEAHNEPTGVPPVQPPPPVTPPDPAPPPGKAPAVCGKDPGQGRGQGDEHACR